MLIFKIQDVIIHGTVTCGADGGGSGGIGGKSKEIMKRQPSTSDCGGSGNGAKNTDHTTSNCAIITESITTQTNPFATNSIATQTSTPSNQLSKKKKNQETSKIIK
ncbi:hypothetical protein ACTA71_011272 [Dictyostelium dimigraforme]